MSYPECPECGTDVFVTGRRGRPAGEYQCQFCGWLSEQKNLTEA